MDLRAATCKPYSLLPLRHSVWITAFWFETMTQTGETPLFVKFRDSSQNCFPETLSAINTFGFPSRSRLSPFLTGSGGGLQEEIHGARNAKQ